MNEDSGAAWRRLQRIGLGQHGVVTSSDARRCKLGRAALRWRLRSHQLERVYEGVFRFPATRESWEQRATAALRWLGPSAALSHASAASLLGLDGFKPRPATIEVLVPHQHVNARRMLRLRPGFLIHRSRSRFGTTAVAGLRVTDLTRTLLDLARVVKPPRRLEDPLDDALDSAQRMYPGVDALLARELAASAQGRKGALRLEKLLEERDGRSTDSRLEARVFRALRGAKVRRPVHQHQVFDAGGYVARLDFAWRDERVALHVDGYAYHQQRSQFEHDRVVASRLSALGWHSLWVTHQSLEDGAWLRSLSTVLARRAPQLALI